jgi:hypothetical protein
MQQMERLLFEEFRGQQELDSGRRNRLDGGNQLLEKGSTEAAAPELEGRSTTKKEVVQRGRRQAQPRRESG